MIDGSTSVVSPILSRLPGLRSAIAISVALFLVATGTLAGNAYWSADAARTATVNAAAISVSSSGAAGLAVTYKQGFGSVSPAALSVTTSISLTNAGGTPLTYTVAVAGGSELVEVALQIWRQGANCNASTAPAANATTGSLATPPAMPSDANSAAAGATVTVCARTTLTGFFSNYAGQSRTPTITFTGRVGDNWSASSSTSFTQTALYNWYRVVHKFSAKCMDASGGGSAVGVKMILFPCKSPNASDNQAFRFEPVGGDYRIYIGNGAATGPVVAAVADTVGAEVQLVSKDTSSGVVPNRQLWTVSQHGAAGDYQVKNKQSGLCLAMLSSADATVFTLDTCSPSVTQTDTQYRAQHVTFTEIG
jgi:Ricin-type beta-trefoil lectin domain